MVLSKKKRAIALLLAFVVAFSGFSFVGITKTKIAEAKGAAVVSVKWNKSSIDCTTKTKTAKLKIHAKDSRQINRIYATLTNGKAETSKKYLSRGVYLYLDDGSNRDGTYTAEVTFGPSDKGKWRVTYVGIQSQTEETYSYELKKKKGIGSKLTVKAGPKTSVKLSGLPANATAGQKVTLQALLKKKGKAFKKQKVTFYGSYTDATGKSKTVKHTVKTNKKGIAKKAITLPSTWNFFAYAYYKGKSKVAQACYSGTKSSSIVLGQSIQLSPGTQDLTSYSSKPTINISLPTTWTNSYYGGSYKYLYVYWTEYNSSEEDYTYWSSPSKTFSTSLSISSNYGSTPFSGSIWAVIKDSNNKVYATSNTITYTLPASSSS